MRTLAIKNRDLVLGTQGHLVAEGQTKVRQELGALLREPLASDRFHRNVGSALPSYIGEPIGPGLKVAVEAEVSRVVQAYMAQQAKVMQQDAMSRLTPRLKSSEIVASLVAVQVRQEEDKLFVKVEIKTLAGEQVSIISAVEA